MLSFVLRVSCSVFRVSCFVFRVSGLGFRVSGVEFRVPDFGCRVSGFGFQVSDSPEWCQPGKERRGSLRCGRQASPDFFGEGGLGSGFWVSVSELRIFSSRFENNYFTEMCSGSEAGSYLRLIDCVNHSTLGLRVEKKKKRGEGV